MSEAVKWYLEAVEKEKEGKMMEAVNCYSKAYKLDPKLEDEDYAMEMYYKYKEPPKEDVLSCTSYTWGFKLFIVDLEPNTYKVMDSHFSHFTDVAILPTMESIKELDCILIMGNSFGLLDKETDSSITPFFTTEAQEKVQEFILNNYEGEQPVGTAFIIKSHSTQCPYLLHAPIMRVPCSIEGTDYVYLATKAALSALKQFNLNAKEEDGKIKTVLFHGLSSVCKDTSVEVAEAVRQMALAYMNHLNPPSTISWQFASARQAHIGYGGYPGLYKHFLKLNNNKP